MSKPKQVEILISEDGSDMQVTAHNFHGQGCREVMEAFQFGNVVECQPTAEYYENAEQKQHETQAE